MRVIWEIQEEQRPWVLHNFGERPSWQPLMGIVEEHGEYLLAVSKVNYAEVLDALADMAIFACDYASAMGWKMSAIDVGQTAAGDFGQIIGRLAHAHLKSAQGIRTGEDHEHESTRALADLIGALREKCWEVSGADFDSLAWATWCRVRQRDWKSDPESAHRPTSEGRSLWAERDPLAPDPLEGVEIKSPTSEDAE